MLSRYDPPYKPWFLRRNEIWLALNHASNEVTRWVFLPDPL